MKFVDSIEILVRAGNGGAGMVSFKTARNKPKLGCDGGDGGFGGDIVLVGSRRLNTLSSLRYNREYKADDGERGSSNNCTGADGEDLRIETPLGTQILLEENGSLLGEILWPGQELIIAKGGKRGLGNQRFVSSTHQTAEEFTSGGEGEAYRLRLELKLLADVGFAGLPNAGKSTLLSRLSSARPKIADYPFTTLVPHLGVVELEDSKEFGSESFVAADIPGLIEGASEGRGLGHAFLRHLERTKVIAYVIDVFEGDNAGAEDGGNGLEPVAAFNLLRAELIKFNADLASKPGVIILNKFDLAPLENPADHPEKPGAPFDLDAFKAKLVKDFSDLECGTFQVACISAVQGQGIRSLKRTLFNTVQAYAAEHPDLSPEAPIVEAYAKKRTPAVAAHVPVQDKIRTVIPVASDVPDDFMIPFRLEGPSTFA